MHASHTRTRLTLTYLGIIMVLSLGFSVIFYRESIRAAGGGFRRQASQYRNSVDIFTGPDRITIFPDRLDAIRDAEINRFRNDLIWRLIALNAVMLGAGVLLSVYLARRSLEPMEEAIEAQSRFTSDAAHELRTPLTAMKTEIEVAMRSKKLQPDEARQILTSNLEEIAKLETLTEALLRLAKNSHQPGTDTHKAVILFRVITTAAKRVRPQADARNISFELPVKSSLSVKADHDQLVELFVILLDNAVKYGTDKTSVTVSTSESGSEVHIAVSDKGVGISEKDLPHIFERFYRADQSRNKNKISGYGLGLSVAEAIVKGHNGSIAATSKLGEGTTFTVTLPRQS